ncbi:MAG: hypothetical protein DWQ34_25505 [Planctomycetota bacterium]|nr:MAG: hypothetical protein DWQ29_12500 [Planctomycetota bacterium]REJ87228.1 MAG: hypothetical protein DWQ34_25505 [Planctomycetota bacterium]REK30016.1 MAG: hypothetical protein DWQ41_02445 [Planctomycetota bacterium]REK37741.1 MAG: hypothetical protein DWQ45_07075 [Planctomycetota bacterium]
MRSAIRNLAFFATACVLLVQSQPASADQLYAPPSVEAVRDAALGWLEERNPDDELRQAVAAQWEFGEETPSPEQRFDAVIRTFYLADEDVRSLVDACSAGDLSRLSEGFPFLQSGGGSPFFTNNVRYFFARYLAVLTMYDESLELFAMIDPAHVVDPAGCLFYRAVCEHSLLMKDEGLETINSLLTSTEDVPLRYSTVAELMQHDLAALQERSLDEVSRQMRDVERRLALGRSGEKVQRVEEKIITTLDEIIEKIEQQQGGGGGGGSGTPRGNQSSNPAQDSYVGGATAPGEVDKKDIGREDGWGDLPDKAQAAAKNLINQQFPFHYRQAVEEYLKRIAQRPAPSQD